MKLTMAWISVNTLDSDSILSFGQVLYATDSVRHNTDLHGVQISVGTWKYLDLLSEVYTTKLPFLRQSWTSGQSERQETFLHII